MKITDIVQTAQTNLLRSKWRTFLTILAITVGSLTLTLTTGLGEGVKDFLDKQTQSVSLKDTLQIQPKTNFSQALSGEVAEYNPDKNINLTQIFLTRQDVSRIADTEGVKSASAVYLAKPEYVTREGQKKFDVSMLNVFTENLQLPLAAGSIPKDGEDDKMILAYSYLKPLGFANAQDAVGKTITMEFRDAKKQSLLVNFTVGGVQINTISGSFNRISTKKAEEIAQFQFGTSEASPAVIATLEKGLSQEKVDEIKKKLDEKGYTAQTFEDSIKQVKQFLDIAQGVISAFGIIVIIAAAIGIINTLLMSVYERTREIGLMKALGMKARDIFLIFAIEAASLGFWGGLVGILLGIGIGAILNQIISNTLLTNFEGTALLAFPPMALLPILIGTIIVGFLAGTLPAIKASRLDPIEALRYE